MKKLVLIIIALFATPSAVSAQTLRASDVAVWVTDSELNDPSFDEDDGSVDFELDEEAASGSRSTTSGSARSRPSSPTTGSARTWR